MDLKKVLVELKQDTEYKKLRRKMATKQRVAPGRRYTMILLEDIAADMKNPANIRLAALDLICQVSGFAHNRVTMYGRTGKQETEMMNTNPDPVVGKNKKNEQLLKEDPTGASIVVYGKGVEERKAERAAKADEPDIPDEFRSELEETEAL